MKPAMWAVMTVSLGLAMGLGTGCTSQLRGGVVDGGAGDGKALADGAGGDGAGGDGGGPAGDGSGPVGDGTAPLVDGSVPVGDGPKPILDGGRRDGGAKRDSGGGAKDSRPAADGPRADAFVPVGGQGEWTQEAHDPQRTGYIAEEPKTPWTVLWTWNGADASGGVGGHSYDAPREAHTVTGGPMIYAPAGAKGLYGLRKVGGGSAWNVTATSFNATPAYDPATGHVLAGGADGKLYKVFGSTGVVAGTYAAGSPINRAILIVGGAAYAATDSGELHKVTIATMTKAWSYASGGPVGTGPAYSASRKAVVYATNDLYVHAVDDASGARKWREKPTPNAAGFPNELDGYWPVVADQAGVVFVRMRLEHNAGLWSFPSGRNTYPNTNAETRTFLQSNARLKNLFALSLDDGKEKFVPALGYGGVEDLHNGSAYLDLGPVPVVRVVGGKQVAYQHFRNGQSNPPDGRWDSHMGEMVLDDQTISGLVAGDLRFVQMGKQSYSYASITDEQCPVTMAGETLFHAHWGASESVRITDRASARGLSYADPIKTVYNPPVVRRTVTCSDFNPTTHYTSCGLTLVDDGRYWAGPGFWVYWGVRDPPTVKSGAYSEGLKPRYTYVSDGLIVVEGNGGDLMVFKHSGP
ncbi:MAG: PQQ-like beta-propeller repeat protein [Deltaproteobacteria bacterium]|nr:PQQ-like beta-propeller repeat protein [Deltaproteobacteria bacterium]